MAKPKNKYCVPVAPADLGKDIDWSQARRVAFPNLKPTTTTISLRLPVAMLNELKALANRMDVPYQSLLKTFLAERLKAARKVA